MYFHPRIQIIGQPAQPVESLSGSIADGDGDAGWVVETTVGGQILHDGDQSLDDFFPAIVGHQATADVGQATTSQYHVLAVLVGLGSDLPYQVGCRLVLRLDDGFVAHREQDHLVPQCIVRVGT